MSDGCVTNSLKKPQLELQDNEGIAVMSACSVLLMVQLKKAAGTSDRPVNAVQQEERTYR